MMPDPDLGAKRMCLSCGARFYDLGTDPATCPVCSGVFSLDSLSLKRARPERAEPKAAPKPAADPAIEADILDEEDEDIAVGDEVLEEDEDETTVPLEDIAERSTDDTES